jgi:hypothetical protein
MKPHSSLAAFLLLPMLVNAQTSDLLKGVPSADSVKSISDSVADSLPGLLQSQLGIDKDQAEGGLGSLLSLASENLDATDLDKLKGMIPGADGYIEAAKKLGALAGPLKNLDGLNSALAKLGISPDVVAKFVPTISDYLGKLGGDDAMKLLQTALGG